MFIIGLMLISLVAIAIVNEIESSIAKQEEFIPVPIKENKINNLRKFD